MAPRAPRRVNGTRLGSPSAEAIPNEGVDVLRAIEPRPASLTFKEGGPDTARNR